MTQRIFDVENEKYIDCVFWGEQYQYLGKSKSNINDLFKVENEYEGQ